MPVVQKVPVANSPVQVEQPAIEPKEYKSIVVDGNKQPLTSLIAFVAGSPWTVTYFSQVVSQHTDLREHDPGQLSIYQQYNKIIDLELRVNTPLSSSQDTNTNLMTVSGTATIYPFLVPNVGDVFIASVGDGGKALFSITNTERKSLNTGSAFVIDYHLLGYVDAMLERYADLESKVNKTLYFDKDRIIDGLSPVLSSEDRRYTDDLKEAYVNLVRFYFRTFYNKDAGTLVIPGQSAHVYDPYLVSYILKIVDTNEALEIRKITDIASAGDIYLEQPQFWQSLLERDISVLSRCNEKMGLLASVLLVSNPLIRGYRYSKMSYLVYPTNPDTSFNLPDIQYTDIRPMTDLSETAGQNAGLAGYLTNLYTDVNKTIPYIRRVLEDDYYVFGQAFYKSSADQTILEALTSDYLKNNAMDRKRLTAITSNYHTWGRLEQYYYLPVLMTLLKTANNEVY